MTGLSGAFREQARVDLELAQAAAKGASSGHALGESVFLAQQCIEKQLKSMILGLGEAMDLGNGDDGILKRLDHSIYPGLPGIYLEYGARLTPAAPLSGKKAADAVTQAHAAHELSIKEARDRWSHYAGPKSPQLVDLWLNSLNVELPQKRLHDLNRFGNGLTLLYNNLIPKRNVPVPVPKFENAAVAHADMRSKVGSKRQVEKLRSEYRQKRDPQHDESGSDEYDILKNMMSSDEENHFGKVTEEEMLRLMVKRRITAFGFEVVRDYVHSYVLLYPHSTLGRYPKILDDGQMTTDIYESQENSVLYSLYVTVPHDYGLLCREASRLDELCALCRKHYC